MTHSIELKEGVHIIRLEKLYSEYENRSILEEIEDLIDEDYNLFILDLGQLQFLNSAGFSLMIGILTKSRNVGGETVIFNINKKIDSLMVMMKLKNVFQVCASETEALAFLNKEETTEEEEEEVIKPDLDNTAKEPQTNTDNPIPDQKIIED